MASVGSFVVRGTALHAKAKSGEDVQDAGGQVFAASVLVAVGALLLSAVGPGVGGQLAPWGCAWASSEPPEGTVEGSPDRLRVSRGRPSGGGRNEIDENVIEQVTLAYDFFELVQ